MKIMTFNIKNDTILTPKQNTWEHRYLYINMIIHQYNPDIIGLQEVTNKMLMDLDLKNYIFVGKTRNRFFEIANERNIILFKKDIFTLLDNQTYWLSSTPNKLGSRTLGSIYPRICTFASLKDKDGKIYKIYNTHLDHLLPIVRKHQVDYLEKLIENNNQTIIMGDFNTTIKAKYLKKMVLNLDLEDCYKKVDNLISSHFNILSKIHKNDYPIDYIFISKDIKIKNTTIINNINNERFVSDHYPIICEF